MILVKFHYHLIILSHQMDHENSLVYGIEIFWDQDCKVRVIRCTRNLTYPIDVVTSLILGPCSVFVLLKFFSFSHMVVCQSKSYSYYESLVLKQER